MSSVTERLNRTHTPWLPSPTLRLLALGVIVLWTVGPSGCQGLEGPEPLTQARRSGGPVVTFDLFARPLPEIPLPNDIATRPDPSSPTGRRINSSQVASTQWEREVRREIDRLDGWGTSAPISVSFEPEDQRLDLGNILRRHAADNFDLTNDAVYLVNIDPDSPDFGRPMPIDLGEGAFPWSLRRSDDYYPNDPRGQASSLMFESVSEDTNRDGVLDLCEDRNHNGVTDPGEDLDGDGAAFTAEPDLDGDGLLDPEEDRNGNGRRDCSEDTDFDGVLDVPNLFCGQTDDGALIPPGQCPDLLLPTATDPVTIPASDAWLTTFYERETNSLILQPLVPLAEQTEYAVVLTHRLVDEGGRAVESPFPAVHHVDQTTSIARLEQVLSDAELSEPFGGLGVEDIQFAWSFTTQSITGDLRLMREGLYGRGPLAELAEQYPPELLVDRLHGCQRGIDCELPENEHIIWAQETGGELGLLTVLLDVLDSVPVDLGGNEEMIERISEPYDAVSFFAHGRFDSPNFLENDGQTEDVDGDGHLDLIDEDVDGDGELDPGEDLDFDGHLDVDEDLDGDGVLDGEEVAFDLDLVAGQAPHGQHQVAMFVSIPRADPERGIEPPYPVVIYNHGYGFMRVESLILAAYMARHGMATVGIDAMHHGIGGLEPIVIEMARSVLISKHLGPFAEALMNDGALDLNGDGAPDSGADFVTSDSVHMRDMVRQTQVDLFRLVQLLRSFDGQRRWEHDLDGDGEPELAGDFDADGVVDLGGPEAAYFVTGNSLGGINSTVFAGLEPSLVAAAPISGGAELSAVGMRTTLGSVQAAAVLPAIGPLMVTDTAEGHFTLLRCSDDSGCPEGEGCVEGVCRCEVDRDCSGESGYRCATPPTALAADGAVCARRGATLCAMDQVSVRWVTNDLNSAVDVEVACLEEDELADGDTLVLRNLANGEQDCFVAWPGARSRLHLPSDRGDPVELTVYEGEVLAEGQRCSLRDDAEVKRVLDVFDLDATFQLDEWVAGDLLVAPQRGFGMHRSSSEIRRLITIAQILLEPADPMNLARHHFLDPVDFGEETRRRRTLNISTVGDTAVGIANGIAIARAAGIVDYQRLDPRLADAEHPEGMTHDRFLIENGVIEGLVRLSPFRRPRDGRQILFDPDDLDRSSLPPQDQPGWIGDGFDAPSGPVPLRMWLALEDDEECLCRDGGGEHGCQWPGDTEGAVDMVRCDGGVSGHVTAYFDPSGSHALIPQSDPEFDVHAFIANMIGRYFATHGRELRYDLCMADNSCTVEEHGFSTPPVEPADE